jgi:hypothetical protein
MQSAAAHELENDIGVFAAQIGELKQASGVLEGRGREGFPKLSGKAHSTHGTPCVRYLIPVPPFSLSLTEYELLPEGHKRCFSCRNVLADGKFSGTRGVCKICSNAQARRTYKLRQLQKKARYQVITRLHPEFVKSSAPTS